MTAQVLDSIVIDGRRELLAELIAPLPHPLPNNLQIRFESESTACYRGWQAGWQVVENGLWLTEFRGWGHLQRPDSAESRHDGRLYRFGLNDIFGSAAPVFGAWVTGTALIAAGETDIEDRVSLGILSSHLRKLSIVEGLIVADITCANPDWKPDFNGRFTREARELRALQAAQDYDKMVARRRPEPVRDEEFNAKMKAAIDRARMQRLGRQPREPR